VYDIIKLAFSDTIEIGQNKEDIVLFPHFGILSLFDYWCAQNFHGE
jgi:hypothetical protein